MKMLNYYRGNELLSEEQLEYLYKVWGKHQYHYIETLPLDENTGTGLIDITNVLYTIWNTEKFNIREKQIIERIKKGVKQSRSKYATQYDSVESNLLIELFTDATIEFNKNVNIEDKIKPSNLPYNEIKRLYGLKYKSILKKIKDSELKITSYASNDYVKYNGIIRKFDKNLTCNRDYNSTFYCYYLKINSNDLNFKIQYYGSETSKRIEKMFPFLAKFGYFSGYGENSDNGALQINLYDYADTENNFQTVMDYLIKNKLINIKFNNIEKDENFSQYM